MTIHKARREDIDRIAELYSIIHNAEKNGKLTIGWKRDIYSIRQTAIDAIDREDVFVIKDDDQIVASALLLGFS